MFSGIPRSFGPQGLLLFTLDATGAVFAAGAAPAVMPGSAPGDGRFRFPPKTSFRILVSLGSSAITCSRRRMPVAGASLHQGRKYRVAAMQLAGHLYQT